MTTMMKMKRLAFCAAYKDWSAADWEKAVYRGDSSFAASGLSRPG
jgi:hypothetical protein